MLVTTEEAKSLRCPTLGVFDMCVANKCMAWRWSKNYRQNEGVLEVRTAMDLMVAERDSLSPLGSCGMAGPIEK